MDLDFNHQTSISKCEKCFPTTTMLDAWSSAMLLGQFSDLAGPKLGRFRLFTLDSNHGQTCNQCVKTRQDIEMHRNWTSMQILVAWVPERLT